MLPVLLNLFFITIINVSVVPQEGIVTGFGDLGEVQLCSALAYLLEDGT